MATNRKSGPALGRAGILTVVGVLALALIVGLLWWAPWKGDHPKQVAAASQKAVPPAAASAPKATDPNGEVVNTNQAQPVSAPTPVTAPASAPVAAAPKAQPALQPVAYAHRPERVATRGARSAPCKPGDTGKVFNWRVSGGNPYAPTREAEFTDAKIERMLYCFGVPRADWAEIKAYLQNKENGEMITIAEGVMIDDMMFGNDQMISNVRVMIPGGQRALRFALTTKSGRSYEFLDPLGCGNWARKRQAPRKSYCYSVPLNYRRQADVVEVAGGAGVSVHASLSPAEMSALIKDDCTFVIDEHGAKKKPTFGLCAFGCPANGQYPDDQLAIKVNLAPEAYVPGKMSFVCPTGKCVLTLPLWALERMKGTLFCVAVEGYPVTVAGYAGYTAHSRFDTVVQGELLQTKAAGRLNRTLRGSGRY
ncbi:MAG: hypothetical protein AAB582_03915 [Patescibacteria group bacterium]